MLKCSYCGRMYEIPRGLTFVMNSGSVKHLCSSKCRKNMNMKRRKVNWIRKSSKKGEELQKEIKAEVEDEHREKVEEKKVV